MKRRELNTIDQEPVSHNPRIRKQVLLGHDAMPGLIQLAQARVPPGETASGHRHADLHEVFTVIAGEGEMQVDDRLESLTPGTCILVEPGEWHEIRNCGNEELVLQYFSIAGPGVSR